MRPNISIAATLLCAAILSAPDHARSDEYPNRPLRLIVPFPAGGGTDVMARLVGQHLADQLGEPVVIENKGGAGGNIGMNAAATSKPDGYTLFFATTGTMTINPALYKDKMQVKPLEDFESIGTAALSSQVVIVNKDLPVNSIKDLITLAKEKPGSLTFGSSGIGGVVHLTGELFKQAAHVNIQHVPYKGSAAALVDLMGGRISMMFDITAADLPYIHEGKVKALAVTTVNRIAALPEVPTVSEAGLPGFVSTSWFGIVVPKGTPPAVRTRLASALAAAMSGEEVKKQLLSLGAEVFRNTPEDFTKLLKADTAKWSTLVETSGAAIQ